MRGTRLHRHAARHFAHRGQQWQAATGAGDGFVGNANRAGFNQRRSLFRVGCEVQVGVQNLARAQHGALLRLRLLDLDDHVSLREHVAGQRHQFRAGGGIEIVGHADAFTGTVLHQYLVAMQREFTHAGGGQADAVFVVLDFFG